MELTGLNPQQLAAARSVKGPIMLLAGAGTGKTRVITYRIGYMLSLGIPASEIVALTFTNKAAREMLHRLKALVGPRAKGLNCGTFHSFCLRLLREHGAAHFGLDQRFSLIGQSEQIGLVTKALEEKGWTTYYKPENLHARISNAKNYLLTPADLVSGGMNHAWFHDEDPELLAAVYDLYERQLRLNHAIDFDDCILKTVLLLKEDEPLRERLQDRYTHFLVDEFQDTNFSQLSVLEFLAAKQKNICVVGDDDQSIYSWRGAMSQTLERFEEVFTGARLIKLEQNYRCSNIILNAANTVIKNNSFRKEKTLWSQSAKEHNIVLTAQPTEQDEARWIAKKCFALLGQGHNLKDIVILYRANSQSRQLELALREMSLRYKVFGGSSFFERKEIKDFLAYLKLVFFPKDRLSFWRVINTPARGLGLKTLEKIEEHAKELKLTPFEVLLQGVPHFTKSAADEVELFLQNFETLQKHPLATPEDLKGLAEQIIKLFKLEEDIRIKTTSDESRRRKVESLRRMPTWLLESAKAFLEEAGTLDVKGLVDHLTLTDDNRPTKEEEQGQFISLMTIHAAKGLEYPVVFICGLEEDLLPHKNSVNSNLAVEEERRLFYVAITRAKEKLFMSHAKERYSSFHKQIRKPSRFIEELPAQGIHREDAAVVVTSPEERREATKQKLSSLKERLKSGFQSNP